MLKKLSFDSCWEKKQGKDREGREGEREREILHQTVFVVSIGYPNSPSTA